MRQLRKYIIFLVGALAAQIVRFVPKRSRSIVLVPRFGSGLTGNVKHMFLRLASAGGPEVEPTMLLKERASLDLMQNHKLPTIPFPSMRGFVALARTRCVVIEENNWGGEFTRALSLHIPKVQLWHGNGFKRINHGTVNKYNSRGGLKGLLYDQLVAKSREYAVVCLSSTQQAAVRGPRFRYKHLLINGQPRNDILFEDNPAPIALLGADVAAIDEVRSRKDRGDLILVYAPTWRKAGSVPIVDALDWPRLNEFLQGSGATMVIKLHPKTKDHIPSLSHIHGYDSKGDVYPLFRFADMMITDYSSIYIDFLLTMKPVVFFPYDYHRYTEERPLMYDYNSVAPGPICYRQSELHDAISQILIRGDDRWAKEREAVLTTFNDYTDGRATERLVKYLTETVGIL